MSTPKTCDIKTHFSCNGSGLICRDCGESTDVCECNAAPADDCPDCEGTGLFCVKHEKGSNTRKGPCLGVKGKSK